MRLTVLRSNVRIAFESVDDHKAALQLFTKGQSRAKKKKREREKKKKGEEAAKAMPSDVYTCTDFPARLPSLLHRHPKASALLLQLSPVATPGADTARDAAHHDSSEGAAETSTSRWSDDDAAAAVDFITFYAVLLKPLVEAGDSAPSCSFFDPAWTIEENGACIEHVCIVVGHVSHVTLQWCAQVQYALSVTSLLSAAPEAHDNAGNTESFVSFVMPTERQSSHAVSCFDGCRRSTSTGVTALLVRLSPLVPPLQWDRHIDGVLGSQHFICASYLCALSERDGGADTEDDEGGGVEEAAQCDDKSYRAADAAAPECGKEKKNHYTQKRQLIQQGHALPPFRRMRHDLITSKADIGSLPLPFHVAAVLNGTVPLPQPHSLLQESSVCVLCLAACDGCLLNAPQNASLSTTLPAMSGIPRAFDVLCDFLAEVMPHVRLDVVGGGRWLCDESGELQRDVCNTRGKLGCSFAFGRPGQVSCTTTATSKLRSIIFVVDFSTPLSKVLLEGATKAAAKPLIGEGSPTKMRGCLSKQITAALQETLGRLASANLDVCSFSAANRNNGRGGVDSGSPLALSEEEPHATTTERSCGRAAQLTREMLCRSIADSVSRIVTLSSHAVFKAEAVRLLWGSGATGIAAATATTAAAAVARPPPSADAIRRRIENCLLGNLHER